jgi:hypothetical protein
MDRSNVDFSRKHISEALASDMLMAYQLSGCSERARESDENSTVALGAVHNNLLNFQLREIQFRERGEMEEEKKKSSSGAGRQKIVNLYELMDRLGLDARDGRGDTKRSSRQCTEGDQYQWHVCVCVSR